MQTHSQQYHEHGTVWGRGEKEGVMAVTRHSDNIRFVADITITQLFLLIN